MNRISRSVTKEWWGPTVVSRVESTRADSSYRSVGETSRETVVCRGKTGTVEWVPLYEFATFSKSMFTHVDSQEMFCRFIVFVRFM